MSTDIEVSKLKLKLKCWEVQFQEENGRKPNKDDVSKSSDDIQDAYRNYFKLTKSVSERKRTEKEDCKRKPENDIEIRGEVGDLRDSSASSSVWSSLLNKTSSKAKDDRSTVSKKILNGNLEKYANKLQANANLTQRNCFGLSYASRRSIRRPETKKEVTSDNKIHRDGVKDESFKGEEEAEEATEFNIFSKIKVKDTTKEEKSSKIKAVNITSISSANRTVRQSAAARFDSPLRNVSTAINCDVSENKMCTLKPFDESFESKLNKSAALIQGADRVSHMTLCGGVVDVVTNCSSALSYETTVLKKDVYEFEEVERIEETCKVVKRKRNDVKKMSSDSVLSNETSVSKKDVYEFTLVEKTKEPSKVVKRKRNDVEKGSSDSVEITTRKPQKRCKTELSEENDVNYERLDINNINSTLKNNKMQQKKEVKTASSTKEAEVIGPKKPRKSRNKKTVADEDNPSITKETKVQKKMGITKTAASKYQATFEAEEAAGFEPSFSNKPRVTTKRTITGNSNVRRENYVRVNLKKKVFCRGHKKFNYKRFKYERWKQLKQEKPFKQCDDDFQDDDRPDSPDLPSKMKTQSSSKEQMVASKVEVKEFDVDDKTPVAFSRHEVADPVCELVNGNLPTDVELEVREALKQFGHSDFRYGQLETIKRVLTGRSTLLIQPTGSGKSFCYLLPAYIYAKRLNAVTIVISPLVSLMDDQLAGVPNCLSAACHHTGMTTVQRQKVRESVSAGKVDVLFLSPEALVSGAGSYFGCLPPDMPPIAFVCIDEIHCVSSWSHNFRPSYLRLCRVVHDVLGVRCILGLTATATLVTANNIRQHLGVDQDPLSMIKTDVLPDNLHLTVSRDNKEEALLNLLKSEPFTDFNSVIIYCIRREQTERLATIIRTCLQKESSEWTAEAYHAGLSASNRRSVQKRFMSDKLRVVVATVAFGMGLNKPDVRAVIHFNMPKSIESYVQEIGRAGRDGKPAYCHLFLDLRGGDRQELRRHVYANTIDRAAVKKLLSKIFRPCRCTTLKNIEDTLSQESGDSSKSSWKCGGHEVAYVIDDAVEELDVKEEGIDTLLCYLEEHPSQPIIMLNRTYGNCVVFSYGGAKQLAALAEKCPAIAMAFALQKKEKKTNFVPTNQIEFNLTEVAAMLGQESYQLRRQLMKLKWTTEEINGVVKYRKTDFVVDFKGLAFHLKAVGDLSTDEQDQLTDYLHKRILLREKIDLEQLDKFHSVLHGLSTPQYDSRDELNESRSRQLKESIRCHFQEMSVPSVDAIESWTNSINLENIDKVDVISNNIRRFLGIHSDTQFTGRAIARVFHGIESPRYPAKVWGRARQFWRCLLDVDFNTLCKLATREILR